LCRWGAPGQEEAYEERRRLEFCVTQAKNQKKGKGLTRSSIPSSSSMVPLLVNPMTASSTVLSLTTTSTFLSASHRSSSRASSISARWSRGFAEEACAGEGALGKEMKDSSLCCSTSSFDLIPSSASRSSAASLLRPKGERLWWYWRYPPSCGVPSNFLASCRTLPSCLSPFCGVVFAEEPAETVVLLRWIARVIASRRRPTCRWANSRPCRASGPSAAAGGAFANAPPRPPAPASISLKNEGTDGIIAQHKATSLRAARGHLFFFRLSPSLALFRALLHKKKRGQKKPREKNHGHVQI